MDGHLRKMRLYEESLVEATTSRFCPDQKAELAKPTLNRRPPFFVKIA
jgi:hypothetical protein